MKKFSEIQKGLLNHIFQKLSTLKTIENQIQIYLPPNLHSVCRVANFENNILTFAVKNNAMGIQLKFALPDLLNTLRTQANLPHLAMIRYYIEPEFEKIFTVAQK